MRIGGWSPGPYALPGRNGRAEAVGLVPQGYHHFVFPHASVRQPLLIPEVTSGRDSVKGWRPYTPAMATGLTDHVWSLKEGVLYRVPLWPPAQSVSNSMRVEDRGVERRSALRWRATGVDEGWKTDVEEA